MPEVEQFTSEMIKKAIDELNLRYFVDSQGDITVRLSPEEDRPCEVDAWFLIEGADKDIFNLVVLSNVSLSQEKLGDGLLACNEWQKTRRWPGAYVAVDESGGSSRIILQFQLALDAGIHQELLNRVTLNVLASALDFWAWAHG